MCRGCVVIGNQKKKDAMPPDQLYFPWVANSFFSKIRLLAYRRRGEGRKILHTGLKIFHSEFFGRLEKEDEMICKSY